MQLPPFKLEAFFAKHEFVAPFMLGSSDPETFLLSEIIAMADEECLKLWNNLKLGYTETHGLPLLRKEIATLYTGQDPKNIIIFSGAEEAIFIATQVLIEPDDHVVVMTPCYQSLKEIPKAAGAKVTEFSLDWKNGNWSFDVKKFAEAVTKKTKLVILNFPHNPTGYHPSHTQFQEIIAIIKQQNAYLLSDEVYRLSEQNPKDCLPNAVDCYEKALSLGVMSKSFGLPGLRLGWLVSHDLSLLDKIACYKNYTTICNSAPSEILALIALRNKDKLLKRNLEIARHNLDLLDDFFKNYTKIFEWYRPKAGFINFPRLKLDVNINDFVDRLIHDEGVLLIPGTLFDDTRGHFRLGFGRRNLYEALARFERFTLQFLSRDMNSLI